MGNILRGEDSLHVCPLLIFNWINVAYFLHPYWNLSDMQKWFMCHVVYLLISHWRQKEIHDKTIPLIPPRLAIPLNILLLVLLFFIGFVPYIRRQIRIISFVAIQICIQTVWNGFSTGNSFWIIFCEIAHCVQQRMTLWPVWSVGSRTAPPHSSSSVATWRTM